MTFLKIPLFPIFGFIAQMFHVWSLDHLANQRANSEPLKGIVSVAHEDALRECQRLFKWRPWNCPEEDFFRVMKRSGVLVTREVAMVRALASAGVVRAVAQACQGGKLKECKCSKMENMNHNSVTPHFHWSGCPDGSQAGIQVAKSILDRRVKGDDYFALVNLHNNRIGRSAVQVTMEPVCRCHGVSGSCSMKTCWRAVTAFNKVGKYLMKSYRNAVIVNTNEASLGNRPFVTTLFLNTSKPVLAYFDKSPDYCKNDATLGRECSRRKEDGISKDETRSCKRLCKQCGLNVKKRSVRVKKSCHCKFVWCCQVVCQTCFDTRIIYYCDKRNPDHP